MTTYRLSDGTSATTVEADDLDGAREEARDWAVGGDWGQGEDDARTTWIDVYVDEQDRACEHREGLDADGDCSVCGAACSCDEHPCTDAECPLHGAPPATYTRVDTVTVQVDPTEPECSADDGEHEWASPIELVGGCRENPGVHAHGGGVVIHEVCAHCGVHRHTDTWAQRPDTGEQGLQSVRYGAQGA